uniref:Uncharacterized protein n=1 Tax=Bionectria ochroleuca TaxID=29856 RepID=A0A8H7K1P5_BIOOC
MDSLNYHDIKEYHETMLSHLPERMFAFAWGGEWPFPESAGWTPERRKNASAIMAKDFGVVWQVQPMHMIQGVNMEIERSAKMWTKEGMAVIMRRFRQWLFRGGWVREVELVWWTS